MHSMKVKEEKEIVSNKGSVTSWSTEILVCRQAVKVDCWQAGRDGDGGITVPTQDFK